MYLNKSFSIAVISSFLLLIPYLSANTIYVDSGASLGGDGTSWATAYKYLQDALHKPAVDGDEIWLAEGTYKPDQDESGNVAPGDRNACFELIAGVTIYGGFPAGGGIWEERDPNQYETILCGDLNGDDEHGFVNNSENSIVVTRISWREGTTGLDGLTIQRGGYGLKNGEHGYNQPPFGGDIILHECTFYENSVQAFFLLHPDYLNNGYVGTLIGSEITNCLFMENNAGIFFRGHSPVFKNCKFNYNIGTGVEYYSFHMWPESEHFSNPIFINCEFIGNGRRGINIRGECTSYFKNCIIKSNSLFGIDNNGMSGGGLTTIVNSTIAYNFAPSTYYAAGIETSQPIAPPILIYNSIIWGNESGGIIAASSQIKEGATIYSSCLQDDSEDGTYINPGITAYNCIDSNPKFVRDPYDGGDGWGVGENDDYGDLCLQPGSPCIDTGDNAYLPQDSEDLDKDGDTTEPIPYDFLYKPRVADGDCNTTDIVDMGAYEFSYIQFGDFAGGCDINFADYAVLALAWLTEDGQTGYDSNCDIALPWDEKIDVKDLMEFAANWLQ